MNKLSLVSAIVLCSCGVDDVCNGSDFTTSHNLCVFLNGYDVSQEDIEYVTTITQEAISDKLSREYVFDFFSTRLNYVDVAKDVDKDNDDVDGNFLEHPQRFGDSTYEMNVEYKDGSCYARHLILAHELLHYYLVTEEECYEHKEGWFIHPNGNLDKVDNESLEKEVIGYQIYYKYCQDTQVQVVVYE